MEKKNYSFVFLLAFLLIVSACKKEDENLPEVQITAPSEGAQFSLPDHINIKAEISDDRQLEYVEVKIIDEEFIAVATSGQMQIEGQKHSLSTSLYLDDPKILSGTYYVKVIASDGSNKKSNFKEIYINAIPNKRKGVFYVTDAGSQKILIRTDSNFQQTETVEQFSDFKDLAILNIHRTVVWSGYIEEDAVAYDTETLMSKWTVNGPENPPNPSFFSLGKDGLGNFLIGKIDGSIQRIDHDGGSEGLMVTDENDWVAQDVHGNESYNITLLENLSTNELRADAFWQSSLQEAGSIPLNFDAIKVFAISRQKDEFWIFGNDNGDALGFKWQFTTGLTPITGGLPNGPLVDVINTRYDEYLLAYENKVVFAVPEDGSATTLINQNSINAISYDPTDEYIFVAHDNGLSVFNNAGFNVENITSNPVIDVEAWLIR